MKKTFDTPGPITVLMRIPAGHVSVVSAARAQTEVDVEPSKGPDVPRVEARDGSDGWVVSVESDERRRFWQSRSYRVEVLCPEGSAVDVKTASADLDARGRFGSVDVQTASGDVRTDHVDGPVTVHTASGGVHVGEVVGPVEARSVSGEVVVEKARGTVKVTSASGDLRVDRAESSVQAHSVSGDQRIGTVSAGVVRLESVSGDVEVGVAAGIDVWLDLQTLSGQAVSELPESAAPSKPGEPQLEIRLKSLSGDLTVRRSTHGMSDG
jgi:DUF4097 and DUF4098 domain-containing protein YvlB